VHQKKVEKKAQVQAVRAAAQAVQQQWSLRLYPVLPKMAV
jgi:hypothetical protein